MTTFVPGPTYQEMLHPELQPPAVRKAAEASTNELDPIHLFNITWRAPNRRIRHVVLPKRLTGIEANIIVMEGRHYPSGSHKVGPAYTTLMEGELAGEIRPGEHVAIGPSTGNFGIGVAYISRLKAYQAIVVMPEGMSKERYQRIRQYGASLDLTPGSESDVILTLERTEFYKKDPKYKILAQFELLPNYRFHRYVTGRSAIEVAQPYGNGRVAAFVSAPGSAGTLAAGDEIKALYPDSIVCALEPKECSTLSNNGRGTHRIEGIGDKMVTLIHNVLTTDYVMRIHDDDCVMGLELLERRGPLVEELTGCAPGSLAALTGLLGVSGICNVIGSIRLARHLKLGAADNVVTIATDGFDRYPSVLADLAARSGAINRAKLCAWFETIFRASDAADVLDIRPREEKQRLFGYKESMWTRFGYATDYLKRMQEQSFWDTEYDAINRIDQDLAASRKF